MQAIASQHPTCGRDCRGLGTRHAGDRLSTLPIASPVHCTFVHAPAMRVRSSDTCAARPSYICCPALTHRSLSTRDLRSPNAKNSRCWCPAGSYMVVQVQEDRKRRGTLNCMHCMQAVVSTPCCAIDFFDTTLPDLSSLQSTTSQSSEVKTATTLPDLSDLSSSSSTKGTTTPQATTTTTLATTTTTKTSSLTILDEFELEPTEEPTESTS